MGLDMYLNARIYVAGYEFEEPKKKAVYNNIVGLLGLQEITSTESPHAEVEVCAIYWRKANAIHNWFVENVQDNIDDCGSYYVSKETLIELRDTCAAVLAGDESPEDVLPPAAGFFFGSTDIDDWYMGDLLKTVDSINRVLKTLPEGVNLYYHSSW